METNRMARLLVIIAVMALAACGKDLNPFQLNDCFLSSSSCPSSDSKPAPFAGGTTNGNGTGSGNTGNSSDVKVNPVSYDGTIATDQKTNGGINVITPDGFDPSSSRNFLGTFKPFYSFAQSCFYQYNFPSILRVYSHKGDPFMDFETSAQKLAWVADLFEDGTFDFNVKFLDQYSHPSVDVDCTCKIVEGYNSAYYTDPNTINCTCAGDQGACSLDYEMM